jgi:phosphoglycerate dehydrogenase-like enzyme
MSTNIEVLITLPFSDEIMNDLRGVSNRLHITSQRASKAEDIPADVWQRTEVLYTNHVLPTPEQATNLRWIQFHWAGIDHAIEAPILKKPDLIATTLSGVAASKLGEFTVMMLLALGHRLPEILANQRKSEWPGDRWERFAPVELRGSTVGIVGYGSIGRQLAHLLQAFGVTVLATKRDAMHPEDSGYAPEGQGDPSGDMVQRLYPPQAIKSMVKDCDFVVITVPLTSDTRNLIGQAELGAMKSSAFIIDISRGGIIDHTALIDVLKNNKIAGAALDVFPSEPLPSDSPLWKMPNVILSPHISGISRYYNERAAQLFAENLHRYLAGLPVFNRYNPEKGY